MSVYEIAVSAISEFANLSELAYGLQAQETLVNTLLVHSSKVDPSQLKYVLPIYGFELFQTYNIYIPSQEDQFLLGDDASWERFFEALNAEYPDLTSSLARSSETEETEEDNWNQEDLDEWDYEQEVLERNWARYEN